MGLVLEVTFLGEAKAMVVSFCFVNSKIQKTVFSEVGDGSVSENICHASLNM